MSFPVPIMLTPWNGEYSSGALATRYSAGGNFSPASTTFPAQNSAYAYQVELAYPFLCRRGFWINGATVNGNVDIGIFSLDGTKITSTGTTSQTPINALQSVAITPILIGPGCYYIVIGSDSATATFAAFSTASLYPACGIMQQATAYSGGLPATLALVTVTAAFLPIFGFSRRSVI